jgi:hypothetical protein
MVCALGTPKRHPESGIGWFRKRVPERLKESVGKSEVKFSLQTRDPVVARIRNLEEMARLERAWSGIDAAIVDGRGRPIARFECKAAPDSGAAAVEPVPGADGAAVAVGRLRRCRLRCARSSNPTPRRPNSRLRR